MVKLLLRTTQVLSDYTGVPAALSENLTDTHYAPGTNFWVTLTITENSYAICQQRWGPNSLSPGGSGTAVDPPAGFTGSLEGWHQNGYVAALKHDYQLILIDARGHGASDKPHDPKEYDMQLRATDVVAVLDDLNLSRAHYLGYSMGGRMGFGLAKYAPERCHSLLIGGMHPYRWGQDMLDQRAKDLKGGMAAYVAVLEAQNESLDSAYKAHLLTSDAEALIASTLEYRDWSGMAEVLPTMTMPCLLFVGQEDDLYPGAQECVQHMPNVTLASFPGLNHIECFLRGDLVLPHVQQFLAEVGQE